MACYVMLCHVTSFLTPGQVISDYDVLSYSILYSLFHFSLLTIESFHFTSYLCPRHLLSSRIFSCLVLSCLVLTCLLPSPLAFFPLLSILPSSLLLSFLPQPSLLCSQPTDGSIGDRITLKDRPWYPSLKEYSTNTKSKPKSTLHISENVISNSCSSNGSSISISSSSSSSSNENIPSEGLDHSQGQGQSGLSNYLGLFDTHEDSTLLTRVRHTPLY